MACSSLRLPPHPRRQASKKPCKPAGGGAEGVAARGQGLRRVRRAAVVGDGEGVPVELAHVTAAEEKEDKWGGEGGGQHDARWLEPLQSAVAIEGGTLKCSVSARPDPARGVRVIVSNWRRGRGGEVTRRSEHVEDAEALSNILGLPRKSDSGAGGY